MQKRRKFFDTKIVYLLAWSPSNKPPTIGLPHSPKPKRKIYEKKTNPMNNFILEAMTNNAHD